MVVVIFILSLAAMLVFPRLPSTGAGELRDSTRALASTFRYLGDKAISTKTPYRLHLSLIDSSITIGELSGGEERTPRDSFLSRRALPAGVTLQDVQIPRLGTMTEGEVIIHFGPGGLEELVTVHLRGAGDKQMTVIAFPRNGKVLVDEGYQEVKL